MPIFFYHGTTRQGSQLRGELVATTSQEAVLVLRQRHVAVTQIREKSPSILSGTNLFFFQGVKGRDLVAFTLQFATMVNAGIPLSSCLALLSTHTEHSRLRQALQDIRQRVETGSTLAESLRVHPSIFSESYVGLVEAGEAGGTLGHVLVRLAHHYQTMLRLKHQVLGALAYPAVIVLVAIVIVVGLLLWVIPIFGTLFADFQATLPWPTVLVLDMSQFFQEYGTVLFLGFCLIGVAMKMMYHTKTGRLWADRVVFQVPLLGRLFRKSMVVQVSRTLSSLLNSGVPILEALDITARSSGNRTIERALQQTRKNVCEGSTVAEAVAHSGVFPHLVTYMIGVGESTGALDTVLSNVADLYEEEVTVALGSVTSILEPLVIVILGLGVGFIVTAMYLPIFSMGSLI